MIKLLEHSHEWLLRRVDGLQFLDLTTVHRTITLTVDASRLDKTGSRLLPIGLFRRGAGRAGIRVADRNDAVVPHLSKAESDTEVSTALVSLLSDAGLEGKADVLKEISRHAPHRCVDLESTDGFDGYADLAGEKWGCPSVGRLLRELQGLEPDPGRPVAALVRLLLDWQNNTLLLLPLGDTCTAPPEWSTLTVTYDEELAEWLPPWERRHGALTPFHRQSDDAMDSMALRHAISRGGPLADDLNALQPTRRQRLAAFPSRGVRTYARRGILQQTWHVAWEQGVAGDVGSHHVEVSVPPELTVVRMRMVSPFGSQDPRVEVADELGARAHVAADDPQTHAPERYKPQLLSLLVSHRDAQTPRAAAVVALITGLAFVLGGALWMEEILGQREVATTTLVLVPSLIAGLLSLRSTSDIADELVRRVRPLIGFILLPALVCAGTLIVANVTDSVEVGPLIVSYEDSAHPDVQKIWIGAGAVLILLSLVLWRASAKVVRMVRESADRERRASSEAGKALLASDHGDKPWWWPFGKRQPTPPPTRWIESAEGDRVPWGWLEFCEKKDA